MRRYSLVYLLSRSFKGVFRNGFMTFASILILTSCLLISGCFGLLIANIYVNLNSLDALNEIVCICHYDTGDKAVEALKEKLPLVENVTEVTYVSKDEALEQQKEKYAAYPEIFNRFTEENNPFPDSFVIKYGDSEDAVNLVFELKSFPEFKSVSDKIETANTLESIKNTVMLVFVIFMAILLFISIVIIMNTVRISVNSRKEEITVMRYVGATNFFISFPFLIETFVIGLISAVIAFALQLVTYEVLFAKIGQGGSVSALISLIPFPSVAAYVILAFVAISLVTCYIGAQLALSRSARV